VARARKLIDARQYVLQSDWGDVQPRADDENAFLASHSWDGYAEWHLGLTDGAVEQTKARCALVYSPDDVTLLPRPLRNRGFRSGSALSAHISGGPLRTGG
jgi:hypothetical protein